MIILVRLKLGLFVVHFVTYIGEATRTGRANPCDPFIGSMVREVSICMKLEIHVFIKAIFLTIVLFCIFLAPQLLFADFVPSAYCIHKITLKRLLAYLGFSLPRPCYTSCCEPNPCTTCRLYNLPSIPRKICIKTAFNKLREVVR